ncbi:uncharacterized protein VNE69_01297 [Vairimorpha necatrix]|uniref:Uncharacterized protein n=1 Tax=Vairimorpha necatrix TaxID=6039 RepID=A0AAX4J8Q2_9MICR
MDLHRLNELLNENKKFYSLNIKLKEENSCLNKELLSSQTHIVSLNNSIHKLEKEIRKLENDLKIKEKQIQSNKLLMRNEFKRKDILNNKLVGTNKSTREMGLKDEINNLYIRNNLLCNFIKDLFDKEEMDFEIFYKILETSNEENLKIFIENLR